jgi:hypothetical protein
VMVSRDFPSGRLASISGAGSVQDVDFRWWDYPRWDSASPDAWNAVNLPLFFGSA